MKCCDNIICANCIPFFSIVTPCYNSVKTIERTMKSILAQDFKDYEYIIVDGGSTDGTLEIIKKYEPLFGGRMRWKSEPDNGIYDAFNKGIERSCGIYCWNVNSDDYIEENALQKLHDYILGLPQKCLPVISAGLSFFDENSGRILRKIFYTEETAHISFENDGTNVIHPATLVPLEIYRKYGLYDVRYKISGDADWAHRMVMMKVPIIYLDTIITNMSNQGVSSQATSWKTFVNSRKDRSLYFHKFYRNPFERYGRFLKWHCIYVRDCIKYSFNMYIANFSKKNI